MTGPDDDGWYCDRELELVCDAPSHGLQKPAVLRSRRIGLNNELWRAVGAEQQRLLAPGGQVGLDETYRFKIVCPVCGDDLTIGDALGRGLASTEHDLALSDAITVLERTGLDDAHAVDLAIAQHGNYSGDREAATHRRLTLVADSGVSRLTLSALRRILTMR